MAETQHQAAPNNGAAQGAALAKAATLEIVPKTGEIVHVGYDTFQGFLALQRVAGMFSASSIVPEAYRNNLANCAIAVNMSIRLGADPLMVMNHLYIVHGRPGWSGQFYIASFNKSGRFSPIRYRFIGEKGKDSWGCVAWAKEASTGETVESSEVTIAIAKSEGWYEKNPKWRSIPQHMLMLRAGAWLVRTVAPELTMGLQTADELEDVEGTAEVFSAPPAAIAALPEGVSAPDPESLPVDAVAEARRRVAEAARVLSGAANPVPEPEAKE